jgi:metallophosphoesterase (TIGR00282 family)
VKILFLGDVMGRVGRDEVTSRLPGLRAKYALDAVIVNAENSAHGYGLTPQICDDLFKAGADCLTTGNHVWDKREIIPYIEKDPRVIRALNYPEGTPGRGSHLIPTARGKKILVIHLMARLYMDALDCPFAAVDKILKLNRLAKDANAIVVDIHGEASSEKQAMGRFCDGRVSFVVGTHTHVPTADTRILPAGTGFQTDAGMCGCYDSVIGMEAQPAVQRFVRKMPGERLQPAEGPVTLSGVIMDIDDATGLCRAAHPLRLGGMIPQSEPEAA